MVEHFSLDVANVVVSKIQGWLRRDARDVSHARAREERKQSRARKDTVGGGEREVINRSFESDYHFYG